MEVVLSGKRKHTQALQTLPFSAVKMLDGFWRARQQSNREAGLRHGYTQLERAGNFRDLRLAAGVESGSYVGLVFMDSDVYKWLEAVAYELFKGDEPKLRGMAEEAIGLIEGAQASDGYLDSYFQAAEPERRWKDLSRGHELYCAGHLIEAALAFKRLLGDERLFHVALRFADHIDARFGPGKEGGAPGHPEIELALVELYRETGVERYLRLAQFFVDERGKGSYDPGPNNGHNGPADHQDHLPVREAHSPEGHAVRQLYLNSGVTDLYLETGEPALLDSMLREWESMASSKLYVTGGLGSRHLHEAFSEPYELPNSRAYCETCAAIASIMWSWRLLLATGESRFADLIEHTLYNAFLSGVSLDSTRYFYCNPLLSLGADPSSSRKRIERMEWPWTPCCPPNVMRTFALLSHYIATRREESIQIHQYMSSHLTAQLESGREVALSIVSTLPWNGETNVRIESDSGQEWTLMLRIPAWAADVHVTLNGRPLSEPPIEHGYLSLKRAWAAGDTVRLDFPMEAYFVEANPIVDSAYRSLALKRGPILYCIEQSGQERPVDVLTVQVDEREPTEEAFHAELLGGVVTVGVAGRMPPAVSWQGKLYRRLNVPQAPEGAPVRFTAIPYYAWANRGPNAMRVWLPRYHER